MRPSSSNFDDLETLRCRGSSAELIGLNRRSEREAMNPQVLRRSPRLAAASEILKNKDADLGKVETNCREKNAACKKVMIGRRWQLMVPLDIVVSISDLLSMPDLIRFRSVCSSWRSAPSSRLNITNFIKPRFVEPWLILYGFQNKRSDDCILLQFASNFNCTLKLPALNGASVLVSKLGWLLCHRGNCYFFYNPFTLEKFDLPDYHQPLKPTTKQVAIFSSPPNSEDCIIFLIRSEKASEMEISWCRPLHKRWSSDLLAMDGNNPLLTGKWPVAAYCSCEEDGSCKCERRNEVFVVWQSNTCRIRYDIAKKVFRRDQRNTCNCNWVDLVDTRLDNLLSNFVEKDAIISFSHFHNTRHRRLSFIPADYKAKTGRNSGAKTTSLKAFWIDPIFPWK